MNKPTAHCLVGIPGSGKTTWRNNHLKFGQTVVSRDDLRTILYGENYKFTKAREAAVTAMCDQLITRAISTDQDLIIDETFCNLKTLRAFNDKWSDKLDIKFVIFEDSYDVDLCHRRNTQRQHSVPYEVIERMFIGFLDVVHELGKEPEWLKVVLNDTPDIPKALIVDIDGTVADHEGVRSPFDWKNVGLDRPHPDVISIVKTLTTNSDIDLVFMSGRDGSCRVETEEWLYRYFGNSYKMLLMRKADDNRKDYMIKMELAAELSKTHSIFAAVDDRRQVVRYWRHALGIRVLQVADGLF